MAIFDYQVIILFFLYFSSDSVMFALMLDAKTTRSAECFLVTFMILTLHYCIKKWQIKLDLISNCICSLIRIVSLVASLFFKLGSWIHNSVKTLTLHKISIP